MSLFEIAKCSPAFKEKNLFVTTKNRNPFVENNLEILFDVCFLASKFTASQQHGGRINALELDDNNAPAIIKFK